SRQLCPSVWAGGTQRRTIVIRLQPGRRARSRRECPLFAVSAGQGVFLSIVCILALLVAVVVGLFVAYNLLHYVLFLLVTPPRDARRSGHGLNEFEERQLVEWAPKPNDFLKHDDENRTYDDVFGAYRDEQANYSTCIFPRLPFSQPYEAEYVLLKPKDGMRLL